LRKTEEIDRQKEEIEKLKVGAEENARLANEIESLKLRLSKETAEAMSNVASSMNSSFASEGQEEYVSKEGYLWKAGGFHKKYRRRNFLLKGVHLRYREMVGGLFVEKGCIALTGMTVTCSNDPNDVNFTVKSHAFAKSRTYNLRAETASEKIAWIEAIEKVLCCHWRGGVGVCKTCWGRGEIEKRV
jgi:hypothetical protein